MFQKVQPLFQMEKGLPLGRGGYLLAMRHAIMTAALP